MEEKIVSSYVLDKFNLLHIQKKKKKQNKQLEENQEFRCKALAGDTHLGIDNLEILNLDEKNKEEHPRL